MTVIELVTNYLEIVMLDSFETVRNITFKFFIAFSENSFKV